MKICSYLKGAYKVKINFLIEKQLQICAVIVDFVGGFAEDKTYFYFNKLREIINSESWLAESSCQKQKYEKRIAFTKANCYQVFRFVAKHLIFAV